MQMSKYIIFFIFIISFRLSAQTYIVPGAFGDSLVHILVSDYKTSITLGYNNARDTMYAVIDNNEGFVYGVYSDFSVGLISNSDPSITMYNGGINCEHIWPQSMGASSEPMKSDMHHLFPCKENINSIRSNNPYGEVVDNLADYWFYQDVVLQNIPSSNINNYSESYTSSNNDLFEPKENRKGDVARSMFYFKTIYGDSANQSFFDSQKDILFEWHYYDPVDSRELDRTWGIAHYQDGIPNPFVIDPTLVWRTYFSNTYIIGDINLDQTVDVLDAILIMNQILEWTNLSILQEHQSDFNADFSIDVLDIMIMINIILN
tara:strand:+ start:310 stop:1263 length:954 start_codon:yes stop_codon:yes gene_type:complete